MTHILLVGNPNCGKTTLFNALTGDNQRVGNWPGVTVEKKTGQFCYQGQSTDVTDLPGTYSLVVQSQGTSQDEYIAAKALLEPNYHAIINVIDACHLERHLYLTSQLLELGKPLVVVLNMMDLAKQKGISINVEALSAQLGCPVIAIQAHKSVNLNRLCEQLAKPLTVSVPWQLPLPDKAQQALQNIHQQLLKADHSDTLAHYYACRLAEGASALMQNPLAVDKELCPDLDIYLADARYQKIHQVVLASQQKNSDASDNFTAKLDTVVLNRFWGIPIFFGMMYLMFLFAINIGGAFQDFFDISTEVIFVQGTTWVLQQLHAPSWLVAILADGLGKGINTTLTFIPVIAAMFFFLSLLETSGYMARAAFVVDKLMRAMGLPGKSFVPLIVGFGCNVPAIMAARTLDSERDRLLTVMMSPFMSCSARLAIYAIFVAAFFPVGGQNVVFSLYLIGIMMAVLTGFLLRKTSLKGQASPLILELPSYHKPALKRLIKETGLRLRFFVFRAGKLIIPVCVLLGGLNAIILDDNSQQSLLATLGQLITPIFAPMGIHQDNWPATVGLLTGMLAKEVVVGTLNSLYTQVGHLNTMDATDFNLWGGLQSALWSIPNNLAQLGSAVLNPVAASAAENEVTSSMYGIMAQRFDGPVGAYAYLLFVLLYVPCVSTMAVIRQEANKYFMWVSVLWSLAIAYACAVMFYQIMNWMLHPLQSALWIGSMLFTLSLMVYMFRCNTQGRYYVVANT